MIDGSTDLPYLVRKAAKMPPMVQSYQKGFGSVGIYHTKDGTCPHIAHQINARPIPMVV